MTTQQRKIIVAIIIGAITGALNAGGDTNVIEPGLVAVLLPVLAFLATLWQPDPAVAKG